MLPGNKPEPSGKVAAASEDGHRRRESPDRHRRDRSYARHGLQAAQRRFMCGFLNRRLLEFEDLLGQPVELVEEKARKLHDEKGQGRHVRLDGLCKALHVRWSLWRDDAMLGQVAAERVDQLRALTNQEITGAEQHCARLLLLGLDRHEAHGRPDRRLTDGFCVRRVVLLAPDERFNIDGRNQPNFMAESADGASPMMGAPAGLHSHDAARALGQKSENSIARKCLAERHAAVSVGAMRLKAPLCEVETDDANFFHGCPLHSWDAQTSPPWHIAMPSGGGIHSINQTLPRWRLTPPTNPVRFSRRCEECLKRPIGRFLTGLRESVVRAQAEGWRISKISSNTSNKTSSRGRSQNTVLRCRPIGRPST